MSSFMPRLNAAVTAWAPQPWDTREAGIAILRNIKASIQVADARSNPIQAKPLVAPSAWGAGTFFAGEVVANGAGAFMALVDNVTSSTIPSGSSPYAVADGSQSWVPYGSAAADPDSDIVSVTHGGPNASASRLVPCVSVATGLPDTNKFNFLGGAPSIRPGWGGNGAVVMASTKTTSTPGNTFINNYDTNIQGLSFCTDSDIVCIGQTAVAPNNFYKFKAFVNNKPVTKGVIRPNSAPNTSGVNYVFSGRKERQIDQFNATSWPFENVWVRPGSSVWAPVNPNRWTLMVNGCSLDDQGYYPVPDNAWPTQVARRLGCDSVVNISKYGTGILNPGGTYVYDVRLQDAITRGIIPDVYVFGDFYNDVGYGGFTQAAFQNAIVSHITQARAGFGPNVPIIVTGIMAGNTGPNSPLTTAEAYAQNAVSAYLTANPGDSLVKFVPVSTDTVGSWLNGNGSIVGASGTFGNADYYVYQAPHLWALGNDYMSQKYAAALRSTLLTLAASAGV